MSRPRVWSSLLLDSQVLQISARERDVRHDLNLAIADLGDIDRIAEVANTALDFDLVMEELLEG